MMTIDCRKDGFDWDQIPVMLRELLKYTDEVFDKADGSDEAWEEFESQPVVIGFGDRTLILPTCAASFNYLQDCLKNMADEFEA